MLSASLLVILAIVVLYFGAEFSLDASEKVGKRLGLSPLLVGMLLIGFGTSLPEMFVGHIAVAKGSPSIAIGSLIGSNIANMLLILGICGLIAPIRIAGASLKKQLGIHLCLSLALGWIFSREALDSVGTTTLLIICGAYLVMLYKEMKEDKGCEETEYEDTFKAVPIFFKLIMGFGMLYIGGEFLVKGGVELCTGLGISEYIVSAIFIAFGTSFPELVTALMASFKKKDTDLIIGNIIGSNLFNCAFILGSLGIYNITFTEHYSREVIALVTGASFLLLIGLREKSFSKLWGGLFLMGYFAIVGSWLKVY